MRFTKFDVVPGTCGQCSPRTTLTAYTLRPSGPLCGGAPRYYQRCWLHGKYSSLLASARWHLCLPVIVALSVLHPYCKADTPPSRRAYQDLYTELDNYLNSFNATLGTPSTYPVLYTGTLTTANGNSGTHMLEPNYLAGVQLELQGLQAMGFKAVMFGSRFPCCTSPSSPTQRDEAEYQQFVNFYAQVASMVRAAGMKLVIENDTMWAAGIWNNWPQLSAY